MKFSKNWLEEILGFKLHVETLVEQLTMAGLEVASQNSVGADFTGVVVGEVMEITPHPHADKLTLCKINIGSADHLNIVCGASNVRVGLKVAVATIGARLPKNFKIKRAKLRGIESEGMLCSFSELELPIKNEGIIEFASDAPIGIKVTDYLLLDDEIIDLEITINRGDCLSILGIAREVAAINRTELVASEIPKFDFFLEYNFSVLVEDKNACPRYCSRIIRGINNEIATPSWMQEHLEKSGIGSINLAVDVTNYVMLLLGQPLHAFDLSKVDQSIVVRWAKEGEQIVLLDGRTVALNGEALVISDANRPLALAGIMGGSEARVSHGTADIFLESAFFDRELITKQSQCYNIKTDSSHRFERGVDYELQGKALDLATSLILKIAGGVATVSMELLAEEYLPRGNPIFLREKAMEDFIGMAMDEKEISGILEYLGMKVTVTADGWWVTVPSHRFDLVIAEDLLEEIARMAGYDNIPTVKIAANLSPSVLESNSELLGRIYSLMEDLEYHEAITYSFVDEAMQKIFDTTVQPLFIENPIASNLSAMRTSLFPGLVGAVKYNLQRKRQRIRLFESGLKFIPNDNELKQVFVLGGVICGDRYSEQWGNGKGSVDFFDLKNNVELILRLFLDINKLLYQPTDYSALHPGQSAQIVFRNRVIGLLGQLHPGITKKLAIDRQIFIFELELSYFINELDMKFKPFSKFPGIHRDLAIVVSRKIEWQQIRDKIVDISGKLLQNVVLFDIYSSENLGSDRHSLAVRLFFQSVDRTLMDSEVETIIGNIINMLKNEFDANLRR